MTCRHVLGLIDAGPLADYPRPHLEAAWRHARHCATCGPALDASNVLTAALRALQVPAARPDLAPAVLARVEAIQRAGRMAAAPAGAAANVRDWSVWLAPAGGFATALAIAASMQVPPDTARQAPSAVLSALLTTLDVVPSSSAGLLAVGAGLAVYVAGLLTPLREDRRR